MGSPDSNIRLQDALVQRCHANLPDDEDEGSRIHPGDPIIRIPMNHAGDLLMSPRSQWASDPHLKEIREVTPSSQGCEDCLRIGSDWVHLRLCLTCGHVGCCDDSPNRHATAHFHATRHPIIQSFEPGEDWRWCYVHEAVV
jgi:hypothetical protein